MINEDLKIALVFENLFSWGGSAVVNQNLAELFPDADIYALYGTQEFSNKYYNNRKIKFSFLNRYPFIKKLYTYYLSLWAVAIEAFDLSDYDLVISSSHSVAKGCITGEDTIHISYVHTPMRYLWDQKDLYSKYGLLKAPFLSYLRMWDVSSSSRPEKIITNSKFVSNRCKRYWGREADIVINPPVPIYNDKLVEYKDRDNYFVIGAPFAENKGGKFVIECAKELGFNLKIIGKSRGYKKLKRFAKGLNNVEFLGKISEEKKWKILSRAKGFLATGIEDFGIFPLEAVSCGTPVLALSRGGYLESIQEDINGVFYNKNTLNSFKKGMEKLKEKDWEVLKVRDSIKDMGVDRFKKEVEEFVRKSI
jgi:glycosyltransferase involved in cell wall biosynthesis